MATDNRSAAEIEREIETERSELKDTLSELQGTFSAENLVRQVTDQFREHGGDISRSVSRSVRDNPLALTLTGVGIAWLIFGQGRGAPHSRWDDDNFDRNSRHVAYGRSAPRDPVPAGPGPDWLDHEPGTTDMHRDTGSDGPSWGDRASGAMSSAGDSVKSAGSHVSSGGRSAAGAVGNTASGARDRVSAGAHRVGDAMSSASSGVAQRWSSAKSGASNRVAAGRRHAQELRERINHGTENMSEDARRRVVAAREAAIDARERATDALARGSDRAADIYEEHPLVMGALALAVGAAVAGALPRTRYEDDLVGDYSDDLYHEAERIYRDEREKAESVLRAAGSEAKQAARELKDDLDASAPEGKTAAQAAADKVKDKAANVSDTASAKADDKNLGNPKTS